MAYRRDVFCEIAFLEKHRDATPVRYSDAENIHRNVYYFLAQNANLKLDVANKAKLSAHCKKMEGAEQNMHTSDLIFRLAKQHTQGEAKSIFSDEHQMKFVENPVGNEAERVKYTYLLNKDEAVCESYREDYGVVVLSPDCWKDDAQAQKHQYLFGDCGQSLKRGDEVGWPDIFKAEHNLSQCNAMVIIDNYIFSKGFFNIQGILYALLPGTKEECLLKDIFHLTIITSSVVNSIEHTYNKILEIIKKIRPNLKIKFDIFINKTSPYQAKENHDRYILTNNVIITSGYGFGLLYRDKEDGKIKTNGELNIMIAHPGIQNFSKRTDEAYVGKLSEVYQQIFNEDSNLIHYYPTGEPCTNRLILSMAELVAKANDTKSCK